MLFSDIEGSTVLLSHLGDRYGEALSAQRAVLRAAISDWRGHELGTEGDSFFVVFDSAADVVACCVAAQHDAELLECFLAPACATMVREDWDAEYGAGRALSQEQAAALLLPLKD
jgi:class 3 adenylate cyclase